jgi:protein O-GlcNAc transferase
MRNRGTVKVFGCELLRCRAFNMNSIESLVAEGVKRHGAGRLEDAERLYKQALADAPNHADALHLLGVIELQRGRNASAAELIERAIAQNARVPAFYNNYGNVLSRLHRYKDAAAAFHQAIQLQPKYPQAYYNLGMTMQAVEDHDNAGLAFTRAIALQPNHSDAYAAYAISLQRNGKPREALQAIDRAILLSPKNPVYHVNRGNIHRGARDTVRAVADYHRAMVLQPNLSEAHNNLGLVLVDQGDLEGAAARYRKAISLNPQYVDAALNLADALRDLGCSSEAKAAYKHAVELAPEHPGARLGLVLASFPLQINSTAEGASAYLALTSALSELESWAVSRPGVMLAAAGRYQPFHLAYSARDVTTELVRIGHLVGTDTPLPAHSVSTRRRIRIAIVSAHLRDHPVWHVLLRGWLTQLASTDADIFLYNVGVVGSEQAAWATNRVAHYVSGQRSVARWRAELARDQPDVILYPEVGMDPIVGALAALRLAPVQAVGWGHPITTGLPTIDIFFSGDLLEPDNANAHYIERLVRLPGTGVTTDIVEDAVEPWGGPAPSAGTVRFALCQQPSKFDPADDILLTQIAAESGGCEFWLVMPQHQSWSGERLRARLERAFTAAGLEPSKYLRFTPWMSPARFNGFLDVMDVYLDCPSFSGYTTALQAVQRGLPIVTLEGRFLRQRLAAGLLRMIGAVDGITHHEAEYVDRAIHWAGDVRAGARWAARRDDLRAAASQATMDREATRVMEATIFQAVEDAQLKT